MFEFIPYCPSRRPENEMRTRADDYFQVMNARRSVRQFSSDPVPRELIEAAITTASTAPSGAHRQPWTFAVVSDPQIKHQIRLAAEEEERQFYEGARSSAEWLEALAPLGTDSDKPYLDIVPWIVVLFERLYETDSDGTTHKNYYVKESVGIACGMFLAALQNMGLCSLTHTPSPMRFLSEVLGRPDNERAFALMPVGYAAADARVPKLTRKPLEEISAWH